MAPPHAGAGALAPPLLLPLPPRPLLGLSGPLAPPPSSSSSSLRLRRPRLAAAPRAASGGGDGSGPPAEGEKDQKRGGPSFPALSEIRWGELLSPEPTNAAAVVLTGTLAWAGASLLLQLAGIFAAIFAAAVKYSFVAAILLFVLIALL
ncbi:hypothetical protein ACP4OV_003809 [Aristida adscensionis]